jgi:Fe-S-cluster containining protein
MRNGSLPLPVLLENTPIMPLCAVCSDPGRCCLRFGYGFQKDEPVTFWKESWERDAWEFPQRKKLPYVPTGINGEWTDDESGREYVSLWYSCPKLGADGRCTIYAERPQACRRFAPGSSSICVLHDSELVRIILR